MSLFVGGVVKNIDTIAITIQYPDAELTITLAADGQAISADLDLGTLHHN